MPTPAVVGQAILKLEWLPAGLRVKQAEAELAAEMGLSVEQKTAVNISGLNFFATVWSLRYLGIF